MSLFMSPLLISLLFKSVSNSCKKLNVLAGAISSLKSDKSDNVAFWVPKTFVPKSTIAVTSYLSDGRSEERRVGKECRGRWSPSQKNKKTNIDIIVSEE